MEIRTNLFDANKVVALSGAIVLLKRFFQMTLRCSIFNMFTS